MADYSVQYDQSKRLLTLALKGFWDRSCLERFEADLHKLADATAHLPVGGKMLVDLRNFTIQEPWIADRMTVLLESAGGRLEKTSVIGSDSMLQRLQARRALRAPGLAIVLSLEEARRWLGLDEVG